MGGILVGGKVCILQDESVSGSLCIIFEFYERFASAGKVIVVRTPGSL